MKDMLKRVLLIGLFLIVVTGCTGVQDKSDFDRDVYVGTEALRMQFVQDIPRPISYSSTGEVFDIAVEMENQGTFPLQGVLYFSGHDQRIIQGLDNGDGWAFPTRSCGFSDILPRSRGNPNGGLCIAEFQPVLNLGTVTDSYQTKLLATAVYTYATNADINFCVDPLPNRFRVSPQSCVMQAVSEGGGQGGPVSVTHVEANAIGRGQVLFRITVENVGPGTVINPNIRPSMLRQTDVGEVFYRIAVPGDVSFGGSYTSANSQGRLNVNSDGSAHVYFNSPDFYFSQFFRSGDASTANRIRMNNGRGIITQVVDYRFVENAFQTPLQIILSYGYMQSSFIPIEIVNVDSYRPDDVNGRIIIDAGDVRIEHGRGGTRIGTPDGGVQIPNSPSQRRTTDISRLV